MSEIALYNIFKRVEGVSDAEAKKVATDVAGSEKVATKADIKDMATKADIKDMATKADFKDMATKMDIEELKTEMHRLSNRTIIWICSFILGYSVLILGVIQMFADKQ